MKTSRYFWKRWRQEYLLGLREFHQTCQANKINCPVKEGEIVVIHDENSPQDFGDWARLKVLCEEVMERLEEPVYEFCRKLDDPLY